MKRIQEKVKDIVEVRSYESLQDFTSNPEQTLAAYHFTDVTSDLMGKWLDAIGGIQADEGLNYALAGYRGVGKSHFMATLGAIVSQPELRSRVTDAHVAASAQTLKRRHYPVAHVKRGLRETLLEELREAVAGTFETTVDALPAALPELLYFAASRAGELPFVLLIDTAFERASRVSREDGMLLGGIAEIASHLNIFVGVALDDDIAGADNINAAISHNFKIDFLDQEHLNLIVDRHIFPKQRQMSPVLHEIYTYFRAVLTDFRWSEQRFAALYPLHPIILEIAPFVRLYVHDFALLSFASEAGAKILGRPANSLIALDEVFDKAENTLRKVEELREAFVTFDRLNAEVVSRIGIMQRLQAKLILKALLILSLKGEGATAVEICAAMLIFDEDAPPQAVRPVEEILERFAAFLPADIQRVEIPGKGFSYKFAVSGKDDLNEALARETFGVPPETPFKILRRLAKEKFADWTLPEENGGSRMDSYAVWRGGLRRGRVVWDLESERTEAEHLEPISDFADWELFITNRPAKDFPASPSEVPKIFWQPAELRIDEIETLHRYHLLTTRSDLREQFGEQIRAAAHAHQIAVEKICDRVFLFGAKLIIDDFEYNFTEETYHAANLSEIFSVMLEPLFEARYPMHPYFARMLGMNEVSILVNDLFSGAHTNLQEVQQLAETYALPLGLVAPRSGFYALESEERLLGLPLAQQVLELVKQNGGAAVSLKTVSGQLKKSPNGLVREARHLLLTALVAQRQIEFVTSKGDRINRRSLDLKIIWDDIDGIAQPLGAAYSEKRLTEWARILTGSQNLPSIEVHADRETVKNGLRNWLSDWESARVLERFNELPDEILNTRIWRLAVHSERTVGSVAETVRGVLNESVSLDEGLHRVADAFSNSEEAFFNCAQNLMRIDDFLSGANLRETIIGYLAVSEPTGDAEIEKQRDALLSLIEEIYRQPSQILNSEMNEMWDLFQENFTEFYARRHDAVMKSHQLQEKFDKIMSSPEWWEFENLSAVGFLPSYFFKQAQTISRRLKQLNCRHNTRETLKSYPFCVCAFSLAETEDWERLPQTLWEIVNQGLFSYRRALLLLSEALVPLIENFSAATVEMEFVAAADHLNAILQKDTAFEPLTDKELFILQKLGKSMSETPKIHLKIPAAVDFVSSDELREKLDQWLCEMPSAPVLMRI